MSKRCKMDPCVSGDSESCITGAKASNENPESSPSGDPGSVSHQFVTILTDIDPMSPSTSNSGLPVMEILKQGCEMGDTWQHKYPLPLSNYPVRVIRTGNSYYDSILPELEGIGYKPLQIVGRGRSGTILLAQDVRRCKPATEREYIPAAVKLLTGKPKGGIKTMVDSPDEFEISSQLHHPNIVSFISTFSHRSRLGLVMEFCENGNLEQLLRVQDARFLTEPVARHYFRQLFSAVEYIHHQGFAHRDICTQNVLVTQDNNIKLCDFGEAVRFQTGDALLEGIVGTYGYQSPEMLQISPYNPRQVDLWSLGCLLYVITVGKLPFGAKKREVMIRTPKGVQFPCERVLPLTKHLIELIKGFLAYLPDTRLSCTRVRNSHWLQTPDNKVQIGNFYLIRQPQKKREGKEEKELKDMYEI